jgi:hypothetical protein
MNAYKPTFLNRDEIFIPSPVRVESTSSLSREISAVQLEQAPEQGRARLGDLKTLPAGATIEVCGAGYNERTVKIRCGGEFFFVFQGDLTPDPLH